MSASRCGGSRSRSRPPPPEQADSARPARGLAVPAARRVLVGLLGFSAIANPFAQWITLLFMSTPSGAFTSVPAGRPGTGDRCGRHAARRRHARQSRAASEHCARSSLPRLWIPSSCSSSRPRCPGGCSVLITPRCRLRSQRVRRRPGHRRRHDRSPNRTPTVCAAGSTLQPAWSPTERSPRRRDRGLVANCSASDSACSSAASAHSARRLVTEGDPARRGGERLDGAPTAPITRDNTDRGQCCAKSLTQHWPRTGRGGGIRTHGLIVRKARQLSRLVASVRLDVD